MGLSWDDPTRVNINLNAPLTAPGHVATLYYIEKHPTVDTQVIVAPFLIFIFTLLLWGNLSGINSMSYWYVSVWQKLKSCV